MINKPARRGKPTQAKTKRAPKKECDPPLAGDGSPTYGELRRQLQCFFRGFYNAQAAVSVCRMALQRVAGDKDIVDVLSTTVLVRMDYHLRRLARLIKQMGGTTPYDDDDEDIDDEAYGEIAKESSTDAQG